MSAHLNDGLLSADFENLTSSNGPIRQGELDDLVVRRELVSVGRTWTQRFALTETLSRTTNGLRRE
jgi:CHASE1-domain containing sensor protein